MEQYQIPQFIEIEDKIIGPLTLKQFLWIHGGCATIFLIWSFSDFVLFIILSVPTAALFAALAFYKINGRPFIFFIFILIFYIFRAKFFLWDRRLDTEDIKTEKPKEIISKDTPQKKLTESKITQLATILDRGEIDFMASQKEI